MSQRIVLATESPEPSGLGEHMLTLGDALKSTHDIVLAAPGNAAGMALLARAARLGLAIKATDPADWHGTRAWLSRQSGALLHVHAGIGWEGLDLVRHGRASGLAVVRTEHLPDVLTDPIQQAAYRAMLASLEGRIAVSKTVFESFAGRGVGAMTIVANGIVHRPAVRDRLETRMALGISPDATMLLTVARLVAQKGQAVLIEALPAILAKTPQVRLVLVGSGPDEADLRAKVHREGLSDHVLFLGTREDVPDLLAAADLFVLPSLFEGLPLALLEAMAAGVPSVAARALGSVEALGPGHAFLSDCGDAADLARAVTAALQAPDRARIAAQASRRRFAERFSAERMARETARVYQSVLERRTTKGHTP